MEPLLSPWSYALYTHILLSMDFAYFRKIPLRCTCLLKKHAPNVFRVNRCSSTSNNRNSNVTFCMFKSNHGIGCAHSLVSSARSKALPHTRRTSRCPVENIIAFLHFQNQTGNILKKNSVFSAPGLWHPSSVPLSVHLGMLLAFELLLVLLWICWALKGNQYANCFGYNRNVRSVIAVSRKLMSVPSALACIRSFSWPFKKEI